MDACYCDWEPPSVFHEERRTARKEHKCGECSRIILPGEKYEHVWGVWEGRGETHRTCSRCLALRDYVQASVPCFCWLYGDMPNFAMEALSEYGRELPGLWFGGARLYIRAIGGAVKHGR